MTAFIMKESTQFGDLYIGVFLTYKSILEYFKQKPGIKITKDYIYSFDEHHNCGYMVAKETSTFIDGTAKKIKYTVKEVPIFNKEGVWV